MMPDPVPKRRRRTTATELAILEDEFRNNPLPSQGERNRIADRVGMSGRAAQVWFQNRRQKEKKMRDSREGSLVSLTSSVESNDIAPLARRPSLTHAFEFPPSPEKKSVHATHDEETETAHINIFGTSLPAKRTVKRQASILSREEVWQHMQSSDPASSPVAPRVAPTRGAPRPPLYVNASSRCLRFDDDDDEPCAPHTQTLGSRPAKRRASDDTLSLAPTDKSARAGAIDTYAEQALARRREHMQRFGLAAPRPLSPTPSLEDEDADDPSDTSYYSSAVRTPPPMVLPLLPPPTGKSIQDDERECAQLLLGLGTNSVH